MVDGEVFPVGDELGRPRHNRVYVPIEIPGDALAFHRLYESKAKPFSDD